MGVEKARAFLRRHRQVALDTCVFVYQLEVNPTYCNLTEELFGWLQTGSASAITSTITMTELLVPPYRQPDRQRVDDCFALLTSYPNLQWIAPSLAIADAAAAVRADYQLKTADAIQVATALFSDTPALITNDIAFKRVTSLEVLVLSDLL